MSHFAGQMTISSSDEEGEGHGYGEHSAESPVIISMEQSGGAPSQTYVQPETRQAYTVPAQERFFGPQGDTSQLAPEAYYSVGEFQQQDVTVGEIEGTSGTSPELGQGPSDENDDEMSVEYVSGSDTDSLGPSFEEANPIIHDLSGLFYDETVNSEF